MFRGSDVSVPLAIVSAVLLVTMAVPAAMAQHVKPPGDPTIKIPCEPGEGAVAPACVSDRVCEQMPRPLSADCKGDPPEVCGGDHTDGTDSALGLHLQPEFPAEFEEELCPEEVADGASCVAHGILVLKEDKTPFVGHVASSYSTSRAKTTFDAGDKTTEKILPKQPHNLLLPPSAPQAEGHADQVRVKYQHSGIPLSVDARTVYSDCEVFAGVTPTADGSLADFYKAYGAGGVEDLTVQFSFSELVGADVLDEELGEINFAGLISAANRCDIVELRLLATKAVDICPAQNTGFTVSAGGATATVILNEAWGPVTNGAGQAVAGTAAVHVHVDAPTTQVDVYIGYAATAVPQFGDDVVHFPFPMDGHP